jgi:hypothetical protein
MQIRCSGERPSCKRCARLRHTCTYNAPFSANEANPPHTPQPVSNSKRRPPLQPPASSEGRFGTGGSIVQKANAQVLSLSFPHELGNEDRYHGIPKTLLLALVELYFDNVYNAHLIFQRETFQQSLALGRARSHVVLSVCAFGARYARDRHFIRFDQLTPGPAASIEMSADSQRYNSMASWLSGLNVQANWYCKTYTSSRRTVLQPWSI